MKAFLTDSHPMFIPCAQEEELDQTQTQLASAGAELRSATTKCKEAASYLNCTM